MSKRRKAPADAPSTVKTTTEYRREQKAKRDRENRRFEELCGEVTFAAKVGGA